jgi:hypothetical protein
MTEPAAPTAPTAPSAAASSSWSPGSVITALTHVGPPLTIVTALLIYFGWARADAQSKAMGIDVSMFGYSTQDYVLRSISTLYLPLLFLGGLGLAWLTLHRHLVDRLDDPQHRRQIARAALLATAGGATVAVLAVLWAWQFPDRGTLVAPLTVAAGTAVAAYGNSLAGLAAGPTRVQVSERALRAVLVGGVITLALFWELSSYAGVVGRGYAERLARTVNTLPRVSVTGPDPLGVQAPGVSEAVVTLPGDAGHSVLRYRTTGLRLLVTSGGRVFLLNDGWRPGVGSVLVLPDDDKLRWQMSR